MEPKRGSGSRIGSSTLQQCVIGRYLLEAARGLFEAVGVEIEKVDLRRGDGKPASVEEVAGPWAHLEMQVRDMLVVEVHDPARRALEDGRKLEPQHPEIVERASPRFPKGTQKRLGAGRLRHEAMHHAHAGEAALVPRRGEDSPRAQARIAAALQYPDPVPAGKLEFGEDRVVGMLPQQGLRDAGIAGDVDVEMAAESMAERVYDLGVGFDEQNTLHAVPTVCASAGELKSCVTVQVRSCT